MAGGGVASIRPAAALGDLLDPGGTISMDDASESHDAHAEAPDEIVDISPDFGYADTIRSALYLSATMTLLIAGLGIAFSLGGLLNGDIRPFQFVQFSGMLLIVGFCFSTPFAIAVSRASTQEWKPVRITALGDEVFIETRETSVCLPLGDCTWRETDGFFADRVGFHRPQRSLLLLEVRLSCTKDHRNRMSFACGFTDESFAQWREFLIARGVLPAREPPAKDRARRVVTGVIVGGAVGTLLGFLMRALLGTHQAPGGLAFTGILDGAVLGFLWNALRTEYGEDFLELVRWPQTALKCAVLGVTGAGALGRDGPIVVLAVAVGNFALMAFAIRRLREQAVRDLGPLADADGQRT